MNLDALVRLSRKSIFVIAGVCLMTLQPVLVTLSQNEAGKLDYNPVVSTMLSEMLKLVIAAILMLADGSDSHPTCRQVLEFACPAFVYFINNNLAFVMLGHMNPTTFQLLGQLKIVFTGILFRLFLGRQLASFQWLAIWQLTCGTAMSQIPACFAPTAREVERSSLLGVALSVTSCMLSAFAGIYTEKLLKAKAGGTIHQQNSMLYSWGIFFNFVGIGVQMFKGSGREVPLQNFMPTGFNRWAYAVVINNTLNGLAISAILKYFDNIVRVYTHATAMLVTMVLSILLFDLSPTPQLLIAILVVAASAVQYNMKWEQESKAAVVDLVKPRTVGAKSEDEERLMENGVVASASAEVIPQEPDNLAVLTMSNPKKGCASRAQVGETHS